MKLLFNNILNTNENPKHQLRSDAAPAPKGVQSKESAKEVGAAQIIRKPRRQTVQDLLRETDQIEGVSGQTAAVPEGEPHEPLHATAPVASAQPSGKAVTGSARGLVQQHSIDDELQSSAGRVRSDAQRVTHNNPVPVSHVSSSVLLQTHGLVKVYDGRAVVDGVDINVKEREIVGLLGPNGAGKTTSFYMIVGLVQPNSGNVQFAGGDVTNEPMYRRARLGMGYLPQEESIFRKLTVEQNIMAVLETQSYTARERKEHCQDLMKRFGIEKLAKNLAITLSGGEKRRLTIARSLVVNPKLLMLDEPFSGVDPIAVGEIQEIICQLREQGLAILITDHNVRETLGIVDRAYLIYEGKVLMEGSRDDLVGNPEARKLYLGERFSM